MLDVCDFRNHSTGSTIFIYLFIVLDALLTSEADVKTVWRWSLSGGSRQPSSPPDLIKIALWMQIVQTTEQLNVPGASLKPQAQFGFPACTIRIVRHLHIPRNHQISTERCARPRLATVALQSCLDFAQENNRTWRLHLLLWITATAPRHSPHREGFTGRERRACPVWINLAPYTSESDKFKLCLFTLSLQLIFERTYGLRFDKVQPLGRLD